MVDFNAKVLIKAAKALLIYSQTYICIHGHVYLFVYFCAISEHLRQTVSIFFSVLLLDIYWEFKPWEKLHYHKFRIFRVRGKRLDPSSSTNRTNFMFQMQVAFSDPPQRRAQSSNPTIPLFQKCFIYSLSFEKINEKANLLKVKVKSPALRKHPLIFFFFIKQYFLIYHNLILSSVFTFFSRKLGTSKKKWCA